MTKVLSLDIGIKNLAFCLFERTETNGFEIKAWDIMNLTEASDQALCQCLEKKTNHPCQKPAKYRKLTATTSVAAAAAADTSGYFCLKHSKKHETMMLPQPELNVAFLKKQRFQLVQEIANKYGVAFSPAAKKADLLFLLEEYSNEKCLKEIVEKNASKLDLLTIGQNIKRKFNRAFLNEGKIDHVIIENQMSPIANRMKTVQGMVLQYFVMNDSAANIEFISASNKLKEDQSSSESSSAAATAAATTSTTTYGARKKLGVAKCVDKLSTTPLFSSQLPFFLKHQKKDDLADCFLQGLWFIRTKITPLASD
jgi:hypothetical protein